MGCFSFICKESGQAVLSTSFSGTAVHLFLLKDGEVIEEMYGNYDSYGKVFNNEISSVGGGHKSFDWRMSWGDVCDLMFSNNESHGIAAVIGKHYKGTPPTTQSEGDPNQGWGEGYALIGDTSDDLEAWVEEPYHKTYPEQLFKVKKVSPSSGNATGGYKSYIETSYEGYNHCGPAFDIHNPKHIWHSTRKEVLAFIKRVEGVEAEMVKIINNPESDWQTKDLHSGMLVRKYLKLLDGISSGLDVRSSWSDEVAAEKIVSGYMARKKEGEEFVRESIEKAHEGAIKDKKEFDSMNVKYQSILKEFGNKGHSSTLQSYLNSKEKERLLGIKATVHNRTTAELIEDAQSFLNELKNK